MVRAILHGCNGRMGKVICDLIKEDPQIGIVAGIDVFGEGDGSFPVYHSFDDCDVQADVVIDFSSYLAFDKLLAACSSRHIPAVVCTTGLTDEQIAALHEAAKETAFLRSANMSLGINLLMKLLKEAAPVLSAAGFDIEIVERHHHTKKDAPSGTALALADSINEAMDQKYTYIYDRSDRFEQRGKNEMGISAVRGGTIVGQHDVIFAGTDEVIEFHHQAYSRAVFAKGAIAAAKFLSGKGPGMYDMSDVIGS